jgi:hypothetical protein
VSDIVTVAVGEVLIGWPWEVHAHYVVERDTPPCPHAVGLSPTSWLVPRVILAFEGGRAGAGLCVECVLDALDSDEVNRQISRGVAMQTRVTRTP